MLLAFLTSSAMAKEVKDGYYGGETKKGWWWYEPIPDPNQKEAEKPLETKQDPTGPKKYPRDFSLDNVTANELWEMHPDDFQALYDTIQKKAVQYPDDEKTMKEYFIMTDMARRKALGFANASQAFLMRNPEYDMSGTIPLVAPGKMAVTKMQDEEKNRVIRDGQNDHALIYLWRPGCQFCDAQAGILKIFTDKYEWLVTKVNIVENPAAAEAFGVQSVPMILLVKKGNKDYVTVSVGVASAQQIEEKVYRGMRVLGGQDPSSFSTYEYERAGGQDVKAPLMKKAKESKR